MKRSTFFIVLLSFGTLSGWGAAYYWHDEWRRTDSELQEADKALEETTRRVVSP